MSQIITQIYQIVTIIFSNQETKLSLRKKNQNTKGPTLTKKHGVVLAYRNNLFYVVGLGYYGQILTY